MMIVTPIIMERRLPLGFEVASVEGVGVFMMPISEEWDDSMDWKCR